MRTRTFLVAGIAVALLLAGVASYYASAHPDGLEYVAEQTGFLDSAEDHAASDGLLAGYATEGVDDARLSGGIAGVVGVLVVLLVAGGLAFAVRRRAAPTGEADDAEADADDTDAEADATDKTPRA